MLRDIAHCTRPCAGETENGDAVFIHAAKTRTLLAVVDALGHGPIAAECAQRALSSLENSAAEGDLMSIMQAVHASLQGTRGAAMTALLFTPSQLYGCAVGNVSLKTLGFRFDLLMSPGVLGGRVRNMRLLEVARPAAGRVALLSDGVSLKFSLEPTGTHAADAACRALFAEHGKSSDDATLLIADL